MFKPNRQNCLIILLAVVSSASPALAEERPLFSLHLNSQAFEGIDLDGAAYRMTELEIPALDTADLTLSPDFQFPLDLSNSIAQPPAAAEAADDSPDAIAQADSASPPPPAPAPPSRVQVVLAASSKKMRQGRDELPSRPLSIGSFNPGLTPKPALTNQQV